MKLHSIFFILLIVSLSYLHSMETPKQYNQQATTKLQNVLDNYRYRSFESDKEAIKQCIREGADPNAHSTNPLHLTPMYLAILQEEDNTDFLAFLLQYNANPNHEKTGSYLHDACIKGFYNKAELLVSKGANTHSFNNAQYTPLMNALRFDQHNNIARFLLRNGARATINDANKYGDTAVSIARMNQNQEMIGLLEP